MSDESYLIAYGHDRLHSVERQCGGLKLVLLATEALTQDEAWQAFSPGELRVYRAGRRVAALATRPTPTDSRQDYALLMHSRRR